MSYNASYEAAKARRFHFLLDELMSFCNTVPDSRSRRGRPVEFPLPILFVLLFLKFDSGLGYRDFVASVNFNSSLLERLGLSRAPSHTLLNSALKRLDTRLICRTQERLARKRPPPKNIAADASGFSHFTGGEWMNLRFKKTRKRRFHALHNVVDTDTLLINASRVRSVPGGDAKHMVALVRRVPCSDLEMVYGDKAYLSRKNVQFISDLGAYAAIEPKRGLRGRPRGCPAYKQLIKEYQTGPVSWKKKYQYGKRNLVETVFSMMKRRFGGGLSSRGYQQRRRELLIKTTLHNIHRLNHLECAGR
jgi:transposase